MRQRVALARCGDEPPQQLRVPAGACLGAAASGLLWVRRLVLRGSARRLPLPRAAAGRTLLPAAGPRRHHLVTLGWVSAVIMGVLYRYVPGLTKQPLRYPRLAIVQWAVFVAGTAGLVANLWLGRWSGAAWSAGVLAAAGILLCVNLWVLIGRASGRGVAEIGIV